jgi:hypothetical protein
MFERFYIWQLPINHNFYGKSEKETSSEDEQPQAPQALEVKPTQEAHLVSVAHCDLLAVAQHSFNSLIALRHQAVLVA